MATATAPSVSVHRALTCSETPVLTDEYTFSGSVVVVAPPGEAPPASAEDGDAALAEALTRLPAAKAAGEVAKRLGLDRKALYARALEMKQS